MSVVTIYLNYFLKCLLLFSLYFLTAQFGLTLNNVAGFATVVWMPSGIALAFLLIWGLQYWPGIFLAAVAINYYMGAPAIAAFGIGIGNTLEPFIGAYLLKRTDFHIQLDRVRDVLRLLFFSAVGSTIISATGGVLILWVFHIVSSLEVPSTWFVWWIGDAMGILTIAIPILIFNNKTDFLWNKVELLYLTVSLIGVGYMVFFLSENNIKSYFIIPLLIWAALRFPMQITILAILLISTIAIWATYMGIGPFHLATVSLSLLSLQLFIGIIIISTITLSATLTELKTANRGLKRSNDLEKQFLANMSHDIRTPMYGIMGMAELLEKTELNSEQQDWIQTIRSSANTLLVLLNDILDYSKIEAGKLNIQIEIVNIENILEEVTQLFTINPKNKKIKLEYFITESIPNEMLGDPTRIKQILTNLIGNALKFTERGKVTVIVSKEKESDNQYFVHFKVSDTGIGISEENQKSLFQPFMQANDSIRQTHGGTGLGLAISKELVKMMGGKIGLTSTLGVGSTFWFTIPFEKKHVFKEKSTGSVKEEGFLIAEKKLGRRILVAEDNPINRQVISQQLKILGYDEVQMVQDGVELLKCLKQQTFNLILLDCQMPKLDGYAAAKEIRRREGMGRHTFIIAMTANALLDDRATCLDIGMDDYIAKPIQMLELQLKLKKYLSIPLHRTNQSQLENPESLINFENLLAIYEGNKDAVNTLYKTFFIYLGESIEELKNAIKNNNKNDILSISHKNIGSSGTFGCHTITLIFKEIEKCAIENKFTKLNSIYEKLIKEYDKIKDFKL